jgi:hypothetical protein
MKLPKPKFKEDIEKNLVKIALILFTAISLGEISCQNAAKLCEKTEDFVHAGHHLIQTIKNPEQRQASHEPAPNKSLEIDSHSVNAGPSVQVDTKTAR